jgi:hypothetical protein
MNERLMSNTMKRMSEYAPPPATLLGVTFGNPSQRTHLASVMMIWGQPTLVSRGGGEAIAEMNSA